MADREFIKYFIAHQWRETILGISECFLVVKEEKEAKKMRLSPTMLNRILRNILFPINCCTGNYLYATKEGNGLHLTFLHILRFP